MNRLLILALAAALVVAASCGGTTAPVRTSFVVEGMHCDGCSAAINDVLAGAQGVLSTTADHPRGVAEVVHRAEVVSAAELAQLIEELGYEVRGRTNASDS